MFKQWSNMFRPSLIGFWLFLLAGCSLAPQPEPEAVKAKNELISNSNSKISLELALRDARYHLLEVQTIESLQDLASEHIENRKLLHLPDLISSLRSSTTQYRIDNDPRLHYLDEAISYNFLLSLPKDSDLAKEHATRTAQLIDYAQLVLWARLVAVREILSIEGQPKPSELQREEDSILIELHNSTGMSKLDLKQMAPPDLAEVHPVTADCIALQQYAAMNRPESAGTSFSVSFPGMARKLCQFDRTSELKLAEALFRFPRKINSLRLKDPSVNLLGIASLASAVGVAFEVELDWNELNHAYDEYRLHSVATELNPQDHTALIKQSDARLAWRLAWYRLLIDLGVPDPIAGLPENLPITSEDEKREKFLLNLLKETLQ